MTKPPRSHPFNRTARAARLKKEAQQKKPEQDEVFGPLTLDEAFALLGPGESLELHKSADDDQRGTFNVTTSHVTISQAIEYGKTPPHYGKLLQPLLKAARDV